MVPLFKHQMTFSLRQIGGKRYSCSVISFICMWLMVSILTAKYYIIWCTIRILPLSRTINSIYLFSCNINWKLKYQLSFLMIAIHFPNPIDLKIETQIETKLLDPTSSPTSTPKPVNWRHIHDYKLNRMLLNCSIYWELFIMSVYFLFLFLLSCLRVWIFFWCM